MDDNALVFVWAISLVAAIFFLVGLIKFKKINKNSTGLTKEQVKLEKRKTANILTLCFSFIAIIGLLVTTAKAPPANTEVDKEQESTKGEYVVSTEKLTEDLELLAGAYKGLITGYAMISDDIRDGMWVLVNDATRATTMEEREFFIAGVGYEVQKIIYSNGGPEYTYIVFRYNSDQGKMGDYFKGRIRVE